MPVYIRDCGPKQQKQEVHFKTAAIVHSATLPPDVGDSRSPEKFYLDGAFWTLPALRALAETQMRFTCPVSRTTRTR